MHLRSAARSALAGLVVACLMGSGPLMAAERPDERHARFIVLPRTDADHDAVREEARRAGGKVVKDLRDGGMLVLRGSPEVERQLRVSARARGVMRDRLVSLGLPDTPAAPSTARQRLKPDARSDVQRRRNPAMDPVLSAPDLMWSLFRVNAPTAWLISRGRSTISVGVADSGLDYRHAELAGKVVDVVDFTENEDPPACAAAMDPPVTDSDLAAWQGGPSDTDWNGHGTWSGGTIASALDGSGVNGIASNVKLVSLKIAQWCGSGYQSTILEALLYAARQEIEVVTVSAGAYLDLRVPDEALMYAQYVDVVQRVRERGTLVIAAAGNEHVRLGAGGLVLSHGQLTAPGSGTVDDLYGRYAVPSGVPGVVSVAATTNVVGRSSAACPPGADPFTACKPSSDPHQPAGSGTLNQLAYYSNYGPRIDISAPGGARKFNLPAWDRGGAPGWPLTQDDGLVSYGAFGITSNYAVVMPCVTFDGEPFHANQCYTTLQGTSMAAPHVAAVAALIASRDGGARRNPAFVARMLEQSAQRIGGNQTQGLNADDRSVDDLTRSQACTSGYCHLGGPAIPDREAYGAGLVDAAAAIKAR